MISTALALLALGSALALDPPEAGKRYPQVLVGEPQLAPLLPLSEPLLADLRERRWGPAADALVDLDPDVVPERRRDALAFLTAWCLVHADRAEEAVDLVDLVAGADEPPDAYVDLVVGEVHLAAGDHVAALAALERVPADARVWPRAQVQRAEVLRLLGRESEAWPAYTALAAGEDPHPGGAQALLALARHRGPGEAESCALARRLWWAYPYSDEAAEGGALLRGCPAPTWAETGHRAEQHLLAGDWDAAIALTDGVVAQVEGDGVDACRFLYSRGRAQYKKNRLTAAAATLEGIGARCVEAEGGYGYKGAYLRGTALFRKRAHAASARVFAEIPELYPESSYADDGYTQAGIALQESGDLEGARALWTRGLEDHPGGDTTPEATWRMALALYLDGRTDEALPLAEALGALPMSGDPVHVLAGRYWAARWRYYPEVTSPSTPSADEGARAEAVALWAVLCREHPHSFYALLAHARLAEVAPATARALADRPEGHDTGAGSRPWAVRLAFWEDPGLQAGLALARLGLIREARVEWGDLDPDALTAHEVSLLTDTRGRAGDWLHAHDALRRWMRTHPPGTLGDREAQVLRLAYPDRYWTEVQAAAAPYRRYEARLLHGLVREESNFNRRIVSFAGAIGLSQLMPATAEQTAGWLGLEYSRSRLTEPEYNLRIGARYLEAVHKQLGDSPYLALAAYNAGAGRQKQWLRAWGNVPTDEYVERIPFRETRHYVKRVMETWQTYHWQFDGGPAFPDLAAWNHQARIE